MTESIASLTERVRAALAPHTDRLRAPRKASSRRIAAVEELSEEHEEQVARARDVQKALWDGGVAWPSGPAEYGGLGMSIEAEETLNEVGHELNLVTREALFIGLHIVAPAILNHGTEELKSTYLPQLFSGEAIGCQLFSEPAAGSDLAGVTTRAVRDGDDWILNGQKVWTSMGHVADIGEALVRTDPEASKHGGLTMFLVDMHAPGVTVRPIRQMTGGAAFNEVFLDEVRVPDSARIGELGEGWKVANTSLASERASMGNSSGPITPYLLGRLATLLTRLGADQDPARQNQVAQVVSDVLAARGIGLIEPEALPQNLAFTAGSIGKLFMSDAVQSIADAAIDNIGIEATIDHGTDDTYAWSEFALGSPALRLAGGTDEIQLNVIAQRGLDMPRPHR